MKNIQQWKVGDVLSASKLNAMVDAINDLLAGQTGNSDVYITLDELNDILKQYSDVGHTHSVNEIADLVLPTKLSQLQNDTSYVTEDYVTNAIANAQLGGDGEVDLSSYATKNYVDNAIDEIELTPGPKGEQGPKGDDGYTPIKGVDYFTTADKEEMLSGYATEKFVSDSIANAQLGGDGEVDLSAYALKEDLPTFIIYEKQRDYLLEGTKYYKTLISIKGLITENASYDAVVIPNFNAGTYTVSGRIRQIYAFTGEIGGTCTLLETIYNSTEEVYKNTFTVTQPCTLVVNFFVDQMDISVLVDGDEIIYIDDEVLIPNLSLNEKLRNDIESTTLGKALTITITENKYLSIQSSFGSGKITQKVRLDESYNNGCFNLVDTVVTNVIGEGNKTIHVVKDAITPVRTYQTLGANHGHPGFSLTVNDKSQIDVGSIWTDGVNDYVMVAYANNTVTFAYPYTFNSQITGASKVDPTATLTHKSGATHTSDIAIDTFKSVASIYKSINKHSVKLFIDDNEISLVNGTYVGSTFIVKEEYNIVDYKAMQEYLKANVGSMCNDDNIEGTLRVSLIYKFTESGACTIYYSIKALSNKVRLQNCGFVQSELLNILSGYTTNRILPGVKEKSGINFGKLVDMSTYNSNLVFYTEDLIDPKQPCNRSIDIITDNKGDYVMGHTIGYICDKFDGSDKHRLSNLSLLWDMRSTKKSYPVGISNVTLQPGDYLSFACFSNYISPYDLQDKVIVNKIVEDDCTYIIIDSTEAITGSYEIKELLGKKISIINSRNFTLDYDYVDSNGINYSIGENGGSAVLKIFNCDILVDESPTDIKIADLEDRISMLEEFDLSAYATEEYVDNAIANAQLGGDGDGNVDLSNYATKEHVHNLNELDGKIKDSQAEFMIPSSNMINPEECVSGFVSGNNGAEYTHATMYRTGYIEVDATKRYFIDATKINSGHSCAYNKNKVFINKITLSSNEIILPEDTKYIRFTIIGKEYVGLIQFNEGEYLLPYEPYGYKFKNSIKVPKINLPAKLYALVDEEFNIYFDNILEYDYKDYHIRVICNEGSQLDRCYRLTPTTSGEIDITIQLYDKYESFITQKTSKVIKSTKTQGDGVTKSVLILGDSTTASGIAVSKLINNFEDDSMNITMLGTIGDSNVKHEGRSGWSYATYYNKESLGNNINAFYNPDTSLFDYSYYCNNTNTPVPDYFILNLGINDVYSYLDDANLTAKLLIIKKQIDHIVSSIQQFDNNVKVCIALPIPPNYSQNGFYDQDQTRNRCKRNNALLVDELIKTYDNRESERIYLIPLHCNLDTEYNFKLIDEVVNKRSTITYKASAKGSNVHPDDSGYWQCADSYWFFLKSLN